MISIIIAIILIAIILFLLFTPIKFMLSLEYKNYFLIKINYLFIKWDNQNKKEKTKNNADKSPQEKKKSKISKAFKKDFSATLSFFLKVISKALKELNFVLSKVRITSLYLQIICAMENAALCAVAFGGISSLIYPVLGILESKTKVSDGAFNLDIRPLYNSTESNLLLSLKLRISPLFLIISALRFFVEYKKIKKEFPDVDV